MLKNREKTIKFLPAFHSLLLALIAVFLTVFWDNAAVLRLPSEEWGILSIAWAEGTDGWYTAETGGRYVDKLAFRISGEIRLKPAVDADWVSFPAGTRSLRLAQKLVYADGSGSGERTEFVYDNNPAYLAEQVLSVKGAPESISVSAVLPEAYSDSAGPDGGKADAGKLTSGAADSEEAAYSGASAVEPASGNNAVYPQYDFSGLQFTDFQIVNAVRINPYLAFGTFAFALCLAVLFFYRDVFCRKPELSFLLICLAVGTVMCVSLPRNKVGYDEETHLQAAMDVAAFPGQLHISDAVVNSLLVTDYNDPGYQPGGEEEMQLFDERLSAEGNYKNGENSPDFYTLPNRIPSYLAMAAGLKLGKFLSLPWQTLILFGRFGNLLLYAVLLYAAIRITPVGKWLLFVIALFPENLFLASTYSYDPFVTGFLTLGFAMLLRELSRGPGEMVRLRNIVLMLASFALGCLPKAVYAPLVLTALLLPGGHFRTKAGRRSYAAAVFLLFCMLLATFILPTVVSPAETGDVRGGATSEVSQVGFILGNPVGYAVILLSQMIRWIPQCFIGPDCTTFMGHLVNGYTDWKGLWVPVFLLLLLTVALERGRRKVEAGQSEQKIGKSCGLGTGNGTRSGNEIGTEIGAEIGTKIETETETQDRTRKWGMLPGIWIFLMIGASCVLIWTSMYVAFTEPGAREIAGVQGRYFIPLLFPLYLLLSAPQRRLAAGSKLASHFDIWYYFIQTAVAVILAATIWVSVLAPFCM